MWINNKMNWNWTEYRRCCFSGYGPIWLLLQRYWKIDSTKEHKLASKVFALGPDKHPRILLDTLPSSQTSSSFQQRAVWPDWQTGTNFNLRKGFRQTLTNYWMLSKSVFNYYSNIETNLLIWLFGKNNPLNFPFIHVTPLLIFF